MDLVHVDVVLTMTMIERPIHVVLVLTVGDQIIPLNIISNCLIVPLLIAAAHHLPQPTPTALIITHYVAVYEKLFQFTTDSTSFITYTSLSFDLASLVSTRILFQFTPLQ